MSRGADQNVYRINPERQELNWSRYLQWWPEFYMFTAGLLFTGLVIFGSNWSFGIVILSIYLLVLGVILVIPLLSYMNRWYVSFNLNSIEYGCKREGNQMIVFHEGDELFRTSIDNIHEIRKYSNENGSMLSAEAGFGIVFKSLDNIDTDEFMEQLKQNNLEHGVHYWMDSTIIGSEKQNEEFESWIKSQGLASKLQEIYVEDDIPERGEMTSKDWRYMIYSTIMLIIAIAGWISLFYDGLPGL